MSTVQQSTEVSSSSTNYDDITTTAVKPSSTASNKGPMVSTTTPAMRRKAMKNDSTSFRDEVLKTIEEAESDFQLINKNLETLVGHAEYRKHAELLFEILYTGGLVAPGGHRVEDGAPLCKFYLFEAKEELASVKEYVDVISKLLKRHKFLQKAYEETTIKLMKFVFRMTPTEANIFAMCCGVAVASQILPLQTLETFFNDHLVKDGLSLQFITTIFRIVVEEQSVEQLGLMLKRAELDYRLLEFMPLGKREDAYLIRHFSNENLESIVQFFKKNIQDKVRQSIIESLIHMIEDDALLPDVFSYVKQTLQQHKFGREETSKFLWQSFVSTMPSNNKPDQIDQHMSRMLMTYGKILAWLCDSAKSELSFLYNVQTTCYDDVRLTRFFSKITSLLYKQQVLSKSALLFWYQKGSIQKGRSTFIAQIQEWMDELGSESEEDEEDEDDEEDEVENFDHEEEH